MSRPASTTTLGLRSTCLSAQCAPKLVYMCISVNSSAYICMHLVPCLFAELPVHAGSPQWHARAPASVRTPACIQFYVSPLSFLCILKTQQSAESSITNSPQLAVLRPGP